MANADPRYDFRRATHPQWFSTGVVKFTRRIELDLTHDTHVIVATIGEGMELGPVVGPDHQADPPVAVANPIFVDVDANGFQPSGDSLGLPLPLAEACALARPRLTCRRCVQLTVSPRI